MRRNTGRGSIATPTAPCTAGSGTGGSGRASERSSPRAAPSTRVGYFAYMRAYAEQRMRVLSFFLFGVFDLVGKGRDTIDR